MALIKGFELEEGHFEISLADLQIDIETYFKNTFKEYEIQKAKLSADVTQSPCYTLEKYSIEKLSETACEG